MTKVIIFDLGGVLIPEKWDFIKGEIAKELKVSSEEFSELMKGFEDDLRKGKIGLIDVYREIYAKALKKAAEARRLAVQAFLEAKHIKNTFLANDESDDYLANLEENIT